MIKSKVIPNVITNIELYLPQVTSEEADICLKMSASNLQKCIVLQAL